MNMDNKNNHKNNIFEREEPIVFLGKLYENTSTASFRSFYPESIRADERRCDASIELASRWELLLSLDLLSLPSLTFRTLYGRPTLQRQSPVTQNARACAWIRTQFALCRYTIWPLLLMRGFVCASFRCYFLPIGVIFVDVVVHSFIRGIIFQLIKTKTVIAIIFVIKRNWDVCQL